MHVAKKSIKVIDDDVTANDYAVDGEELEEVYLEVVAVFYVSVEEVCVFVCWNLR